tara:strand:- start:358 stop:1215 length:858 start_codon:yes stop_codon:yes gene_type:complete
LKNYNLTIAIPTYNEEKHIRECIEAIGNDLADEIFVIDSFSSDQTTSIAESLGAKIIQFKWNGRYPKKRNWFLYNYGQDVEWILFLDADEILTHSFKSEIKQILPKTRNNGFYINYSIYFLGKKLSGGVKMKKLALFKASCGNYERIEENSWSNLDMEVHEHPIINGKIGSIISEINHKDYNGITRYIEKHNQYSSWETYRYLKIRKNDLSSNIFNSRQKLKYLIIESPLSGIIYFVIQYILFGGWKDGLVGLYFALLKSSYFIQISCKIYEQKILSGFIKNKRK